MQTRIPHKLLWHTYQQYKPNNKPITNYKTPIKVLLLSTELALKANMEYGHVIMDVGAAIQAYHLM